MVKYDGGLRMEGFYFLVLKHLYWWDLFVKWGELQGPQLPHSRDARWGINELALDLVRGADVTIAALANEHCIEEEYARRSMDGPLADHERTDEETVGKSVENNGLVKLGIFWFKIKEKEGGEVLWEKRTVIFVAWSIVVLRRCLMPSRCSTFYGVSRTVQIVLCSL